MDITNFFTILCGFLLIVCLTLSITCLVVMRNAVEETSAWQKRAEALVGELGGCVAAMKETEKEDVPVLAPNENEKEDFQLHYCLRIENNSIGVFDADGYLIKQLQMPASLLPIKEREKLQNGVWVRSWEEVQKLIQDYE